MRAVLTDVEGTTTRITLVRDVLFPYARSRLAAFVRDRPNDPAIGEIVEGVRRHEGDERMTEDQAVAHLLRWSDEDRKVTPLKTLQGLIWAEGYARGELRGHVYDDAVAHLRAWRDAGVALYVYSSGSVPAQKLLFGHSEFGDLTPLFSGFFDTRIGGKLEARSYTAIAEAVGVAPREILFLSDHVGELDAARASGLSTTWIVRESSTEPANGHARATTFAEVRLGAGA
jgi:enolase-phosphatase E1